MTDIAKLCVVVIHFVELIIFHYIKGSYVGPLRHL